MSINIINATIIFYIKIAEANGLELGPISNLLKSAIFFNKNWKILQALVTDTNIQYCLETLGQKQKNT